MKQFLWDLSFGFVGLTLMALADAPTWGGVIGALVMTIYGRLPDRSSAAAAANAETEEGR
jgi:hypothetical protein